MEILNRAKNAEMDIIPPAESKKNILEEANRRSWKAGYTTRLGEPVYRTKIMNNGFGESKLNVWERDENGNLIND